MALIKRLDIRRTVDAVAAVRFTAFIPMKPVSVEAMHAALAAHDAGIVRRKCPPCICADDDLWSDTIHFMHTQHLCDGSGTTPDEIIADLCARVAAYRTELLAFRAAHREAYLRTLRVADLWFISADVVHSITTRRREIEAAIAQPASRETGVFHGDPIQRVVRWLLDLGPSRRTRDEFRAARAAGMCDALQRVSDAIENSAVLRHLLRDIKASMHIFEYHPVDVALEDALWMLRSVAPDDEFDALVDLALRKRRHSTSDPARSVRTHTLDL